MERLFCFLLSSASMAGGKFINCLGRLFCFRYYGENLPSHSQSILHGDHTDGNLPSSPLAFPCGIHNGTATGSCTCGLDTLRDGSFDFYEIEKKFEALLFNEGQSQQQSEADISRKETEISTQEEEDRIGSARIFSNDELQAAIHFFDPVRKLGAGGYGSVYLGKLKDGQTVAIKVLHDRDRDEMIKFVTEINLFCSLRHENLLRLYGFTTVSREALLVYEYVSNGTVAEHLHGHRETSSRVLSWDLRMQIAVETADALAYLHFHPGRQSIIHCDIKTDNILLDDTFHVKVGDFGLCAPGASLNRGALGYLDPEYDNDGLLTEKSDVYSFGVVLLELISGQMAVDVNRDDIYLVSWALNMITNKELELLVDPNLESQSDSEIRRMINMVAELARSCLESEQNKRPSMAEVVWSLKRIRENKDQDVECVDFSVPDQTPTADLSNLVPFYRRTLQEKGSIDILEQVRSSYGHKLSTIVLFWCLVNPECHATVPVNDTSPWGTSCGCRLYLQNNRILEGLAESRCFFGATCGYIVTLASLNDISILVAERTISYMMSLNPTE